jgi:hypothetical protein
VAILAVFTEIIRERFRQPGGDLSWTWDPNFNPKSNEAGNPSGPRKVLIEPSYSETAEVRNYRPAIYVDRGTVSPIKEATANLVGQQLPTGLRAFYTRAVLPINITIETSRKGESATLADTVWFHVLGAIEQIRSTFDVQDITPPQLGATVASDKDRTVWVTQVAFTVTVNLRWTTTPISLPLREIGLTLNDTQLRIVTPPR